MWYLFFSAKPCKLEEDYSEESKEKGWGGS